MIADLRFAALLDAEHLCKSPSQITVDKQTPRELSFGDYFRADPRCPQNKKRLLWVSVSAGWCQSCYAEMSEMQQDFSDGTLADVAPLSIIFETQAHGEPATLAFLAQWIEQFKLTFPAAIDPDFTMGRFFGRSQVPFNMLVDSATMRVVYRQTGAGLSPLRAEIATFLGR